MEKKHFRNMYLKKRKNIPLIDREKYSKKAFYNLKNTDLYKGAHTIFVFVSMGEEIQTHSWILEMLQDNKEVFIPYTEKGNPHMYMTQIYSLNELEENPMGILQVPRKLLRERTREKVDLVLTPGLAFDDKGYRLGYGGGFYDRFFSQKKHRKAYGVGFSIQRVPYLIHEDWDLPVEGFISENGLEIFS